MSEAIVSTGDELDIRVKRFRHGSEIRCVAAGSTIKMCLTRFPLYF